MSADDGNVNFLSVFCSSSVLLWPLTPVSRSPFVGFHAIHQWTSGASLAAQYIAEVFSGSSDHIKGILLHACYSLLA